MSYNPLTPSRRENSRDSFVSAASGTNRSVSSSNKHINRVTNNTCGSPLLATLRSPQTQRISTDTGKTERGSPGSVRSTKKRQEPSTLSSSIQVHRSAAQPQSPASSVSSDGDTRSLKRKIEIAQSSNTLRPKHTPINDPDDAFIDDGLNTVDREILLNMAESQESIANRGRASNSSYRSAKSTSRSNVLNIPVIREGAVNDSVDLVGADVINHTSNYYQDRNSEVSHSNADRNSDMDDGERGYDDNFQPQTQDDIISSSESSRDGQEVFVQHQTHTSSDALKSDRGLSNQSENEYAPAEVRLKNPAQHMESSTSSSFLTSSTGFEKKQPSQTAEVKKLTSEAEDRKPPRLPLQGSVSSEITKERSDNTSKVHENQNTSRESDMEVDSSSAVPLPAVVDDKMSTIEPNIMQQYKSFASIDTKEELERDSKVGSLPFSSDGVSSPAESNENKSAGMRANALPLSTSSEQGQKGETDEQMDNSSCQDEGMSDEDGLQMITQASPRSVSANEAGRFREALRSEDRSEYVTMPTQAQEVPSPECRSADEQLHQVSMQQLEEKKSTQEQEQQEQDQSENSGKQQHQLAQNKKEQEHPEPTKENQQQYKEAQEEQQTTTKTEEEQHPEESEKIAEKYQKPEETKKISEEEQQPVKTEKAAEEEQQVMETGVVEQHPEESEKIAEEDQKPEESEKIAEEEQQPVKTEKAAEEEQQAMETDVVEQHPEESEKIAEEAQHPEESEKTAEEERQPEETKKNVSEEKQQPVKTDNSVEEEQQPMETDKAIEEDQHPEESEKIAEEAQHPEESEKIAEEERQPEETKKNVSEEKQQPVITDKSVEEEQQPMETDMAVEEAQHPEESEKNDEEEQQPEETKMNVSEEKQQPVQTAKYVVEKQQAMETDKSVVEEQHPEETKKISEEEQQPMKVDKAIEEDQQPEESENIAEEDQKLEETKKISEEEQQPMEADKAVEEEQRPEESSKAVEEQKKVNETEEEEQVKETKKIVEEEQQPEDIEEVQQQRTDEKDQEGQPQNIEKMQMRPEMEKKEQPEANIQMDDDTKSLANESSSSDVNDGTLGEMPSDIPVILKSTDTKMNSIHSVEVMSTSNTRSAIVSTPSSSASQEENPAPQSKVLLTGRPRKRCLSTDDLSALQTSNEQTSEDIHQEPKKRPKLSSENSSNNENQDSVNAKCLLPSISQSDDDMDIEDETVLPTNENKTQKPRKSLQEVLSSNVGLTPAPLHSRSREPLQDVSATVRRPSVQPGSGPLAEGSSSTVSSHHRLPKSTKETDQRQQSQIVRAASSEADREVVFWERMAILKERTQDDFCDGLQGFGLETEQQELRSLVQAAVENGESSSLVIMGQQGAGKSFLVDKVLRDVSSEGHTFLRVSLDGNLQVDDLSALKEITRQLCLGGARAQWKRGTFSQHLRFLLSVLFEGAHSGQRGVPLIFVLEHFEAFAQRRKQTLLYNLLDLTQSRDARIVLIGCTHRIDVVEQMEKRIKSRFDNRQMFLGCPSFDVVQKILLERLMLPGPKHANWNNKIQKLLGNGSDEPSRGAIELMRLAQLGFSTGWFLRLADIALSRLRMRHRRGTRHLDEFVVSDLRDAANALQTDVRENIVFSLSTMEILLLASVIHMEKLQERRAFNFELTYAQASKYYCLEDNHERPLSRAVARKSFEHLVELGIFCPAQEVGAGQGRVAGPAHRLHRLMIDPENFLDSLRENKIKCQSLLQQWALSMCTT